MRANVGDEPVIRGRHVGDTAREGVIIEIHGDEGGPPYLDGGGAEPTAAEVRIEYASLLGWVGGLVVAMLGQLEAAQHIPYMPAAPSL